CGPVGYGVGGGGVGVDREVRVCGWSRASPPGVGSSRREPAAMAIGATGSAAGATGSATGATGSAIEGWPAIEPPATEPPAMDPPAAEPPASEPPRRCRLASDGALLAAFSSRICKGSQSVRSTAAGSAAERSLAPRGVDEHAGQAEDVAGRADGEAFGLLRRHEPGRADHEAGTGQ